MTNKGKGGTAMLPSWFRVLRYWDDHGGTGLSFSLIIGATLSPIGRKFDDEAEAKEYAREIYDEMAKAYIDGFSVITYGCDDGIGGPAFKLEYFHRRKPLDKAFDELWEFYGADIVAGRYSCSDGEFSEIDREDEEWIKKALEACKTTDRGFADQ
jgi:hypothetical protein